MTTLSNEQQSNHLTSHSENVNGICNIDHLPKLTALPSSTIEDIKDIVQNQENISDRLKLQQKKIENTLSLWSSLKEKSLVTPSSSLPSSSSDPLPLNEKIKNLSEYPGTLSDNSSGVTSTSNSHVSKTMVTESTSKLKIDNSNNNHNNSHSKAMPSSSFSSIYSSSQVTHGNVKEYLQRNGKITTTNNTNHSILSPIHSLPSPKKETIKNDSNSSDSNSNQSTLGKSLQTPITPHMKKSSSVKIILAMEPRFDKTPSDLFGLRSSKSSREPNLSIFRSPQVRQRHGNINITTLSTTIRCNQSTTSVTWKPTKLSDKYNSRFQTTQDILLARKLYPVLYGSK